MDDPNIHLNYPPGRTNNDNGSDGESKEEKRSHVRKPFFMPVDYSTRDRVYRDFIKDISMGGVFIETLRPPPVGQEILMAFSFPNLHRNFKITGDVVRMNPKGIGVAFLDTGKDQMETLDFCINDI